MMQPGTITGSGEWVEAESLGRSIENEMVVEGLVDTSEDTADIATQRRKALIAISRGIINYSKLRMDLVFAVGDLKVAADPAGVNVPSVAKTLSGKVQ
jgi:hypothetical protein